MVPDESLFVCPTSGVLLGVFVKCFNLDDPDISGPAATNLGSASSCGRTARRYFKGERLPDEKRRQICDWVGKAICHQGLLAGLSIPTNIGNAEMNLEEYISTVVSEWLNEWDSVYVRATAGWPHPPKALSGFVIGRLITIDLSLRLTALIHLCSSGKPDSVEVFAHYPQPGRVLLEFIAEQSGTKFTRDSLANTVSVERSTVDRWIDSSVAPTDRNLARLAERFRHPECTPDALLRWLRIQYGLIRLKDRLTRALGLNWSCELLGMIWLLLNAILAFHQCSKLDRETFLSIQSATLRRGCDLKSSYSVLNALRKVLQDEDPPLSQWIDDLIALQIRDVAGRLQVCFSRIGDWPMSLENWRASRDWTGISEDDVRLGHISAALLSISPTFWTQLKDTEGAGIVESRLSSHLATPRDIEWASDQAWTLMQAGEFAAALPMLQTLVRLDPTNAELLCNLGQCLWRASPQPRFQEAIDHLDAASRLRPDWDYPVLEMARMYVHHGCPDHAITVLERALQELIAASADGMYLRGLAYCMSKRWADGLKASQQAFGLDPLHGEAWNIAAECAFQLGDKVLGRRYAKQASHLGEPSAFKRWCS